VHEGWHQSVESHWWLLSRRRFRKRAKTSDGSYFNNLYLSAL
jgi:hypothetical protein